ncbi:MAG TPA: hypothetical protein VIU40_14890 [Geobacteraceae bacterium]
MVVNEYDSMGSDLDGGTECVARRYRTLRQGPDRYLYPVDEAPPYVEEHDMELLQFPPAHIEHETGDIQWVETPLPALRRSGRLQKFPCRVHYWIR